MLRGSPRVSFGVLMSAMTLRPHGALAAVALAGLLACAYPLRQPQPPSDPRERQRAEVAACNARTLPPWLDDEALRAAVALDQREAQASSANEGFHGAAYTAPPPPPRDPGLRSARLFEERRAFQRWCAAEQPLSPVGGTHDQGLEQHGR